MFKIRGLRDFSALTMPPNTDDGHTLSALTMSSSYHMTKTTMVHSGLSIEFSNSLTSKPFRVEGIEGLRIHPTFSISGMKKLAWLKSITRSAWLCATISSAFDRGVEVAIV